MAPVPYPIKWAKALLESDAKKRERLVASSLLVHMDKRGICFPSVRTLCRYSGYGRTLVFESLAELERLGWLTRSRTDRANRYAALIPGVRSGADGGSPAQTGHKESREEEDQEIPGGW